MGLDGPLTLCISEFCCEILRMVSRWSEEQQTAVQYTFKSKSLGSKQRKQRQVNQSNQNNLLDKGWSSTLVTFANQLINLINYIINKLELMGMGDTTWWICFGKANISSRVPEVCPVCSPQLLCSLLCSGKERQLWLWTTAVSGATDIFIWSPDLAHVLYAKETPAFLTNTTSTLTCLIPTSLWVEKQF